MHVPRILALLLFAFGSAVPMPGDVGDQTVPPRPGQPGKDVVWIPTPPELIETMLDMAHVTPQDFVIDLGSGDGRNVIAAAKRGARALGVEYNPELVELSRRLAKEAGVANRAAFVQGDMYAADISQATVLALFLKPENLDRMRDKFLALKPGTRFVFNTFGLTDWEADVTRTLGPPCATWCTAMLVIVPAPVAGAWRVNDARMDLKQYYQFVRGTIGRDPVAGRLNGSEITLQTSDTEYSGRVIGNRIVGHATVSGKQTPWMATRERETR
jgi:precorrin-6B methylase 2